MENPYVSFSGMVPGDDNYIRYLHKAPYSGGKPGFLDRETPLAPPSGIKNMFERLKESGYEIGVATDVPGLKWKSLLKPMAGMKSLNQTI